MPGDRARRELAGAQAPIREQLDALAEEMSAEMVPYGDRLEELAEDAERIADEFDPDLPDRPEPIEPDVDRDRLLYGSRRHWRDQLVAYRRGKGGPS
jgi:hypothetical protein